MEYFYSILDSCTCPYYCTIVLSISCWRNMFNLALLILGRLSVLVCARAKSEKPWRCDVFICTLGYWLICLEPWLYGFFLYTGPAAFRPRAHPTTSYTPSVEKGRPVLQGLLAIDFLAKEVFWCHNSTIQVADSFLSCRKKPYVYIYYLCLSRCLDGRKQCRNLLVISSIMCKLFWNEHMKDVEHLIWRQAHL